MIEIQALDASSASHDLASVRALFRRYSEFLRASTLHAAFGFDRFEQEIAELPLPYTSNRGQLLVAKQSSLVAGCIAYRAFPGVPDPACCEIKRLFVSPEFRGQGIGRQLIRAALDGARGRGFRIARLDTEPLSMGSAYRLYLEQGFTEYQHSGCGTSLLFLEKSLV